MMYIRDKEHNDIIWYVGDPIPDVQGPVVTFQADGHELIYLLAVMREHADRAYPIAVMGQPVIQKRSLRTVRKAKAK